MIIPIFLPDIIHYISYHYRVSYYFRCISQRYHKFIIPPYIQIFSFPVFSYEDYICSIASFTSAPKFSLLICNLFIDCFYFFSSGHLIKIQIKTNLQQEVSRYTLHYCHSYLLFWQDDCYWWLQFLSAGMSTFWRSPVKIYHWPKNWQPLPNNDKIR